MIHLEDCVGNFFLQNTISMTAPPPHPPIIMDINQSKVVEHIYILDATSAGGLR